METLSARIISPKNFNRICRTCFGFDNVNPIFQSLVENIKAADLLEYSVAIQVDDNDSMPQNICDSCLTDLYRVYEFKKQCEDNQTILKSLLEDDEIETKIEEEEEGAISIDENTLYTAHNREITTEEEEEQEGISIEDIIETHKIEKNASVPLELCSICGKMVKRPMLPQHMRVHRNEQPHECDVCSQKFSLSGNLRRHKMIHTGERPHLCATCGKSFIQAKSLQEHEQRHNGVCLKKKRKFKKEVKDPFLCVVCLESFNTRASLKAHTLIHSDKSFSCGHCSKTFQYEYSLRAHLKAHIEGKPHSCKICQKRFRNSSYVAMHMLCHTGERPYICDYCPQRFRQMPHLKLHIRSRHTGEKPHICPFCERGFASSGNLLVHVRTHTGEKPYSCPVCPKGFYDSTGLKRHRRTHLEEAVDGTLKDNKSSAES